MVQLLTTGDGARAPVPSLERPVRDYQSPLETRSALERVRRAPSILTAMRATPEVLWAVDRDMAAWRGIDALLRLLEDAIDDESDTVLAISAVHALGRLPGDAASASLERLLRGSHRLAAHAAWAARGRAPSPLMLTSLASSVATGGLAGMHAQEALRSWSGSIPDLVLASLEGRLSATDVGPSRRYLVETIGLIHGSAARRLLSRVATDPKEPVAARQVAIEAFAERLDERIPASIASLARRTDELGASVRITRTDRLLARRGPRFGVQSVDAGIRVAQVHLGASIDADARTAGVGDAGGVATLLARLGSSLTARPGIGEVITIGRAPADARAPRTTSRSGHRIETVPLVDGEGGSFAGAWPAVVAARRGLRRALLAGPTPDVVHLRMADPGSLVAASEAKRMGIPMVFTLAPDPHGPIHEAEAAGRLGRRTFGDADATAQLWYRVSLVNRLARQAQELVVFPRGDTERRLHELVGTDLRVGPPRHTVVPEGIDISLADKARARLATEDVVSSASVLRDLSAAIDRLPPSRRGLPIVVSVGRMHEIKGMARVIEAFGLDRSLASRANLVIVGGGLDDPSAAESAELARIQLLFARHPGLEDHTVLLGHRPNDDVSLILAAAHAGLGTSISAGGAYVCGSAKEEFGLAIVEALAAGLPVVAPRVGGPATYVRPERTGVLADTTNPRHIAEALKQVLDLAGDASTGERASASVRHRYTLERMARILAVVYRLSAAPRTLGLPADSGNGS